MGYKYDPDSKRQRRFALPICKKCGKRSRRGTHVNCTPKPSTVPVYPEPKDLAEARLIPVYHLSQDWIEKLQADRQERLTSRALDAAPIDAAQK